MGNLIDVTVSDDDRKVFAIGVGIKYCDLTKEERIILEHSNKYLEEKEKKRNKKLLDLARKDFERLRDIPNMPFEAIKILKYWTWRDEDDEDE